MKPILFLLLIGYTLQSCSVGLEKIGEISFSRASQDSILSSETTIDLNKGDVLILWNDMSIETKQKEKVRVSYQFEQVFQGKSTGQININALKTNPTILQTKENARGRLIWSFQGEMKQLYILESGSYTFKIALLSSDKEMLINRAKLVFKRK